ncbi:superoxide dismutase [Paraphaeosphaeria minitans]|uniref:Superoxide dismutase n=1 Tax=Paraphaeosphaeria minitans TaxID=565426 RepID=A0A9P6G8G3_9PLEO|nr:superoxide dismutase [Paraphaeosphaeria minitans]
MPSLTLILITLAIPTLILGTGLPNPSGNISTGLGGDAAIVNNNPAGAKYTATFPGAGANISGTVTAASNANGTGVLFSKAFLYLQDHRSAHLDPYRRGQFANTPMCDPTKPQTCEVGDRSGKHGNITGLSISTSYVDLYASTLPGIGAFFGNRSIVIHRSDGTRLACANWVSG